MSYEWWQKSVRSGKPEPVNESDPQEGFFRIKLGGKFVPLAIWWSEHLDENNEPSDDAELICMVGFDDDKRQVDPMEILSDLYCASWWIMASKNPITEARYRHAMLTGRWDDVDPVVEQMQEIASDIEATTRLGIGGNQPPEVYALKDQIAAAKSGVEAYREIKDDATAAKAQTLRSHLLELAREADKRRDQLKRPYLEAGKAIDADWQPIIKDAKSGAEVISGALSTFLTAKARAEAEERRKAEETASEQSSGVNVPTPQPAPQQTMIKGGVGRAAAIKVVNVITGVTDWEALFAYLKGNPELDACMLKVAQQFVNMGHKVPGVTIEEKRKVA